MPDKHDAKSNAHETPSQRSERRRTLRKLLGGAGMVAGAQALPEHWTKSLVSSVILPGHAQTSPISSISNGGPACSLTAFNVSLNEGRIEEGGDVIPSENPEAELGAGCMTHEVDFQIALTADSSVNDAGEVEVIGPFETTSGLSGTYQITNGAFSLNFDNPEAFVEIDYVDTLTSGNEFALTVESASGQCSFQTESFVQLTGEAEVGEAMLCDT